VVDSLWRGTRVDRVIAPTADILRAASEGDLDLVITHAPELDAKWLAGNRAALTCPFVSSGFVLVGPTSDPAGVAQARTAVDAMRRIAGRQVVFVSSSDSSPTHLKELALWQRAGVRPRGTPWYVESQSSVAATLATADDRRAYALADLPTLAHVQNLRLRPLFNADPVLVSPFTLYVVRKTPEHPAARPFVTWALTTWRSQLTGLRLADGTSAFVAREDHCGPAPKKAEAPKRAEAPPKLKKKAPAKARR